MLVVCAAKHSKVSAIGLAPTAQGFETGFSPTRWLVSRCSDHRFRIGPARLPELVSNLWTIPNSL
jgi:hypothetical protein